MPKNLHAMVTNLSTYHKQLFFLPFFYFQGMVPSILKITDAARYTRQMLTNAKELYYGHYT